MSITFAIFLIQALYNIAFSSYDTRTRIELWGPRLRVDSFDLEIFDLERFTHEQNEPE